MSYQHKYNNCIGNKLCCTKEPDALNPAWGDLKTSLSVKNNWHLFLLTNTTTKTRWKNTKNKTKKIHSSYRRK